VTTPFENVDPEVRTLLEEVSGARRRGQIRRRRGVEESFAADVARFAEALPRKRREYAGVLLLRAFYGLRSTDPRYAPIARLERGSTRIATSSFDSARRLGAAGAIPEIDPDSTLVEGGAILRRACGLAPGSKPDLGEYHAIARAAHALAPCSEAACYLAHTEAAQGRVHIAVGLYERAVASSSSRFVQKYALTSLAAIRFFAGDVDQALVSIRKATEVDEPLMYSLFLRLFHAVIRGDGAEIRVVDRLLGCTPGAGSWCLDDVPDVFARLLPVPRTQGAKRIDLVRLHPATARLIRAIGEPRS